MTNYCGTCKQEVTNQWAIIGNKHVGCPAAGKDPVKYQEYLNAVEDKVLETASEVMGEMGEYYDFK